MRIYLNLEAAAGKSSNATLGIDISNEVTHQEIEHRQFWVVWVACVRDLCGSICQKVRYSESCFLGTFAKFLKTAVELRHACSSVRPSTWNNSAPTGRIFMKFDIWIFFGNLARTFKFHYNLTTIMATLLENVCTFISRRISLRMRNQNTHFVFDIFFFPPPKIVPFMRECWTTNNGQATNDNIIWRMRIACWITEATNTHSQYVILIALSQQRYLHGRALLLGYRHAVRECNTYCFSTAGMSTRTRLNFTLYVHCLSFHLARKTVYTKCVFLHQIHCIFFNQLTPWGSSWQAHCSSSVQEFPALEPEGSLNVWNFLIEYLLTLKGSALNLCSLEGCSDMSTCSLKSEFLCFVWISAQTVIIPVYNTNWIVFITETECLLRGMD